MSTQSTLHHHFQKTATPEPSQWEQDSADPLFPLQSVSRLSSEQLQCLKDIVYDKKNVFITGGGGVGKSFLIKVMCEVLEYKHITYALTATTGTAAVQIGGCTIHSYSGLGTGESKLETYLKKIPGQYGTRFSSLGVLIIDEISMLLPDFFRKLDAVIAACRGRPRDRFGGLQVVFVGDFFQLPPVWKGQRDVNTPEFVFETLVWRETVQVTHHFTTIFRQKGDTLFQEILQRLRVGKVVDSDMKLLQCLNKPLTLANGIQPTRLYSTNNAVDQCNNKHMASLPGLAHSFGATGEYVDIERDPKKNKGAIVLPLTSAEKSRRSKLVDNCLSLVPPGAVIQLKVNSQVLLTYNLDVENGFCNGSRGVVKEFTSEGYPVVMFASGDSLTVKPAKWKYKDPQNRLNHVEISQMPLKLAWAITIHRSQGMTVDALACDLKDVFASGMAYVCLSRAVSLDRVQIMNITPKSVWSHPKVMEFYRSVSVM